ncbi:Zn-ribbon domain-containing OB-fold protein [Streptomyces rapamycinicus]|uniref:DUF35 domain-containing protein n=2 Tax=Streptomyces rapamycinicus TaxID=1226757 RepID=A0A0A0NVB8_STRRN|nr:Zn-ribbon domain-containing OB-fold protein [Streptomyces rapamycinicus]AGP60593.1 hypothetical protein M271_46140 [Streptomyces rapamycinicus NRRL 5491]MBB4788239.1 putative OB-fold protein [Streptomyces rapamycinicus]RLV72574.1 hypothetical protein D3C57_148645 [Streptomyces rapamycinicus NRRL 5491]UTP36148.1 Zn-ribbon domain-containing OB-fold protein [Streptomyces rapamycinicus NRRL 5491]
MTAPSDSAPRPKPRITPDADAYWDTVRTARARSCQRCTHCDRLQFYPRLLCVHCGGPVEQLALSGHGTVYSFTVVHRAPAGFTGLAPYAVTLVDLDEGVRVMGRLITDRPEDIRIGGRVHTLIEEPGEAMADTALPQFVPVIEE